MPEVTKKGFQPLPHDEAEKQAGEILAQMDLQEKIAMIGGTRGFFIQGNERLNLPEVLMADASSGVNIRDSWEGEKVEMDIEKSVAFPCLIQLASTWNSDLAEEFARSIGEECRAGGIAILLGPGMNIYRHSQCGRNFEYLGEDPFLAARLVSRYVDGLQSTGVAATLKHFIANNSDFFRRKSNSIVDNRALHEIYMPAFAAGIKAGARAVMTAYNLLNGEWCSQSQELITGLLRNELGFQWLVMTDWWAINDSEKTAKSGQDLEMPAREILADIEALLQQGIVTVQHIDRMVTSILKTCIAMDFYRKDFQDKTYLQNFDRHEEIAFQTAAEGIVLLKNHESILPLRPGGSILVTGRFVTETAAGGGAASVKGYNHSSLIEELAQKFGGSVQYVENPTDEQIAQADTVLVSTGTLDSEGRDRAFALPPAEEQRVLRMVGLNSRTIVLVSSGGGIRMTDWSDRAAAILYTWYGGQTGNRAVAQVICGDINPSGRLPISIEREFADSPGADYIPAGEELYMDWNDEGEKRHKVFDVPYTEGILVGYRWYEKKGIQPLFPFGHGLSYTQFAYENLQISADEITAKDGLTIKVDIRNLGEPAGKEVIQVYVRDIESTVLRPEKELKGFCKIPLLPGETGTAEITLTPDAFSFWDEETAAWRTEPGEFEILVGSSSRDIHLTRRIRVNPAAPRTR
ncbi:MAG: beta-glucosidase [Spirochaeta sp.]